MNHVSATTVTNHTHSSKEAPVRHRTPIVCFQGVQKTYDGSTLVVRDLNLEICSGEFLSLLGPSGSGKTTTLMMLAGFESPTAGEIFLNGRSITRTPPHKRNFGMVFQNYALFPHLSIEENVAYPLTVRKLGRSERETKVQQALDMVQMGTLGRRYPGQLSGGQQQRVALARALVFDPQLVLMDEPLGALDKQLREHMQLELKELHRKLGLTFVYVTHDQSEALTMSDRVAVFNDGAIQQIDTVTQLYEAPSNRFVAGFVGDSTMLRGSVVTAAGDTCELVTAKGARFLGLNVNGLIKGASALGSIRPERIEVCMAAPADSHNTLGATVSNVIYFGDHLRLRCSIEGQEKATVKLPLSGLAPPVEGMTVWLKFPAQHLRVYA